MAKRKRIIVKSAPPDDPMFYGGVEIGIPLTALMSSKPEAKMGVGEPQTWSGPKLTDTIEQIKDRLFADHQRILDEALGHWRSRGYASGVTGDFIAKHGDPWAECWRDAMQDLGVALEDDPTPKILERVWEIRQPVDWNPFNKYLKEEQEWRESPEGRSFQEWWDNGGAMPLQVCTLGRR